MTGFLQPVQCKMYSIKYFDHNTIQHIQYNVHAYNKFMYKYIVVKEHKVYVIYITNIIDKFTLPFKKVPTCICFGSILSLVQVLLSLVSGYGNI